MKSIQRVLCASALAILTTGFSSIVLAQSTGTAAAQAKPATTEMTDAEVRKVDKGNKKITLKHAEIKNLDMPPMTMVFLVNDVAMLDKVKAGDKVRFKASNDGGKMTVTEMQAAK
ncbi:MAG: copper-binding protein [Ramlibacter sp.]|nr:copper-binding protein [Ramlibacter sp.]